MSEICTPGPWTKRKFAGRFEIIGNGKTIAIVRGKNVKQAERNANIFMGALEVNGLVSSYVEALTKIQKKGELTELEAGFMKMAKELL